MAITLPSLDTDRGLLANVLAAEARSPGQQDYDEREVYRSMQAMRTVIENRLAYPRPGRFLAPDATTWTDILLAPNQIQGFSRAPNGCPTVDAATKNRLDAYVAKANSSAPGKYCRFLENAIAIANGPMPVDPFGTIAKIGDTDLERCGTYAWHPASQGDPGGDFMPYTADQNGIIAHTQFYGLLAPSIHRAAPDVRLLSLRLMNISPVGPPDLLRYDSAKTLEYVKQYCSDGNDCPDGQYHPPQGTDCTHFMCHALARAGVTVAGASAYCSSGLCIRVDDLADAFANSVGVYQNLRRVTKAEAGKGDFCFLPDFFPGLKDHVVLLNDRPTAVGAKVFGHENNRCGNTLVEFDTSRCVYSDVHFSGVTTIRIPG